MVAEKSSSYSTFIFLFLSIDSIDSHHSYWQRMLGRIMVFCLCRYKEMRETHILCSRFHTQHPNVTPFPIPFHTSCTPCSRRSYVACLELEVGADNGSGKGKEKSIIGLCIYKHDINVRVNNFGELS